jgi:hypothetical protein
MDRRAIGDGGAWLCAPSPLSPAQSRQKWPVICQYQELTRLQTIADAWFKAGKKLYKGQPATGIFANALSFKVVGWDTTMGDKLLDYTDPDPDFDLLQDVNQQVYP